MITMNFVWRCKDKIHNRRELVAKVTRPIYNMLSDTVDAVYVLNDKGNEVVLPLGDFESVKIDDMEIKLVRGNNDFFKNLFDTMDAIENL